MIARTALLSDLQTLLKRLEADLLQRSQSAEAPGVEQMLRADYEQAKESERTAQSYSEWRSDYATQMAAAWVLSCVFVRFLEDNRLIDSPKIAGPGERLQRARDEHEIFFRAHPKLTDRDYLLAVLDELACLPGVKDIFGPRNPIRELPNWLSGDAGGELLRFFQRIDANTGALVHDFTDREWDTRFLGDLYQDLSEAARKKYALLQTPEFVEEFILERTLEPALDEFRVDAPALPAQHKHPATPPGFRMMDPACGSGHFLLGAFRRILNRWQKQEPGLKPQDHVIRTLQSVCGVDLNPYAVAITRFRLFLAAMRACGISRLKDAPPFEIQVACGDSLRHGPDTAIQPSLVDSGREQHAYWAEDLPLLRRLLRNGHYHAVVANPPYITPKDRAANDVYRRLYPSCHRQYSLSVPFMERIFRLAIAARKDVTSAGYTGQITANSFMKREFGKKLIEGFLPTIDLTHVIDASGAYIPGHGTPTVILLGRNRPPVASTIRTVMGIRGEPSTPENPSKGLVWSAIVSQIDQPGSQSEFVSVGDSPREAFEKHPWSIGGGGAAELKERIEERSERALAKLISEVGASVVTREDEVYQTGASTAKRRGVSSDQIRPMIDGEDVRDWGFTGFEFGIFPYTADTYDPIVSVGQDRLLWHYRTGLAERVAFGKTQLEHGKSWFEYSMLFKDRLTGPFRIAQAEVATHNHFVLDRGGKVFKQTAPVIKLPTEAGEDDHLALLGLLNSSTACFWLRQACFPKGGHGIGRGIQDENWESRFAFNATNLQQFPTPAERPFDLARLLDQFASHRVGLLPDAVLKRGVPTRQALELARAAAEEALGRMIALQEELDWECYELYGLLVESTPRRHGEHRVEEKLEEKGEREHPTALSVPSVSPWCASSSLPPPLRLGQRAFEIVMARRIAAGELQTTWFDRHASTPITELPADWPEDYKRLVERRIERIETDRNIALIEQPEYKRRWNTEPWESQLGRALRNWLLDRLESYFDFDGRMGEGLAQRRKDAKKERDARREGDGRDRGEGGESDHNSAPSLCAFAPLREVLLLSVARLADVARQDADFMQVGELYRNDPAFAPERLVAELVELESVPLLPILRYKPSGLAKRAEWERTWELQREEDRTGQRLDIPVPPKYTSADFLKSDYWRLRGKLDVPKERWVSFPHCEGPDGTLVIAWAGYDHLQLARAVSAYYVEIQERLGGHDDPRLVPLLACLLELLPWLKQWHNAIDPEFGIPMGDYFEGFIQEEARQLGKTIPEIKAWQPPQRPSGRRKRS